MVPSRWLKSSVHCFSLGATLAVHDQTKGARSMKKTNMIDCRDIIRLRFDLGLTHRQIASSTGVASGTVANVLKRVTEAGLGQWPLPKDLDETALRAGVNRHSTVTHYQRPNMTYLQEGGTGEEVSEILFFSAKSKRRPSLIYSMQIIPVCLSIVARRKGVSATRRGGSNWTPIPLLVGHPCKLFHRHIR